MSEGDPAPDLDLTRPPTGLKTASALVRAVAASDDRIERHYLEVKSDLQLNDAAHLAKIAKFILGAANRLPETAMKAFGGYAVLVAGVAPGEVRGVMPVEKLDLDKQIDKYLGVDGPRWDILRVPVEDSENEVLIIVVDPPEEGQDPFICRKEGPGLYDGRIYIRADGETREAKSGELELLMRRGKSGAESSAAFQVDILGSINEVDINESATLEAYISQTKTQLLRALPRDPARPSPGVDLDSIGGAQAAALEGVRDVISRSVAMNALLETVPESRTRDEYLYSIDQWEAGTREAWQESLDDMAATRLSSVAIRVANLGENYLEDAELRIHLVGDVRGIESLPPPAVNDRGGLSLPSPPRKWGPVTRNKFGDFGLDIPSFDVGPIGLGLGSRSSISWENSGSVSVRVPIGDLRPRGVYLSDDADLILVIPAGTGTSVSGTWEVTVRGHHRVYSGEVVVPVAAGLSLTDEVRELLGLE